jgi:ribose transport system permease protein
MQCGNQRTVQEGASGIPLSKRVDLHQFILVLTLLVMWVVLSILSPHFLSVRNLSSIGISIATIAILAVGQTFVILTGGIDLSVGNVLGLVGVVTAVAMTKGLGMWGGIIVGILVGLACGAASGTMIAVGNLPPFIVGLGMMGITRGIALLISGGFPILVPYQEFGVLGIGTILGSIPVPVVIMVILYGLGFYILRRLRFGRYTYAIGSNEETARLAGIDVAKYKILVYTLCGLTAAIAGLVETARLFSAYPTAGSGYEMDAIAAVVIGGTSMIGGEGNIMQTLVGALTMATLRNGCNLLGISPFVQQVVIGLIIIGAVYVDRVRHARSR